MRYNEYTIPVEQVVDEAPMGLMKTGMNKLASFVPGSIGAKAKGALQTGGNANAMYKEFYTYLGKKGLKPTTASISAFLQTKGVSPDIIKKHVVAGAGSAAKYPGGASGQAVAGGGEQPAAAAGTQAAPAASGQAAPAASGQAASTKAPRSRKPAAAGTQAAPTKAPAAKRSDQPEYNTPIAPKGTGAQPNYNSPAEPTQGQSIPQQTAPMPQNAPQPGYRVNKKAPGTGDQPNVPESRHMNEDVRLQKLLSKISKRL
jgi:hypothetical protein